MKFFKLFILALLIHGSPSCSMAQVNGTDGKPSYIHRTNYIKNPSAAKNTYYLSKTQVNYQIVRNTTVKYEGVSTIQFGRATGPGTDYLTFDTLPFGDEVTSGNCSFSGYYLWDPTFSIYGSDAPTFEVTDGTNVIASMVAQPTAGLRAFELPVSCGSVRVPRVKVEGATTNPARIIVVGSYGSYVQGYIQIPNIFSADISSTGVISNKDGPDHFNVATVPNDATSLFAVTFKNVSTAPKCWLEPKMLNADNASGRVASSALASGYPTSLEVRYTTFISNSSSPTSGRRAYDHTLFCKLQGADYSVPALTVQDMDYGPRPYTPTFQGFGTVTSINCTEARQGAYNIIDCSWVNGTVTNAEARISLPTGRNVVSNFNSRISGTYYRDVSLASNMGGVVIAIPGNSFLNIGRPAIGKDSATFNPMSPSATDAAVSTGQTIRLIATVPIEGWGAVTAPPIAGLVGTTSSTVNSFATGYIIQSTACTSTPCTPNKNPMGLITSTYVRSSSGVYVVTFSKPFADIPDCSCNTIINTNRYCNFAGITASTVSLNTGFFAGTTADEPFRLSCTGPIN